MKETIWDTLISVGSIMLFTAMLMFILETGVRAGTCSEYDFENLKLQVDTLKKKIKRIENDRSYCDMYCDHSCILIRKLNKECE
jgi:hypothetical protein